MWALGCVITELVTQKLVGDRVAALGAVSRQAAEQSRRVVHGEGLLAAPPFVDAHFHLDATLTLGRPRLNASGTLLEGIALWAEQKPSLTEEDVAARAIRPFVRDTLLTVSPPPSRLASLTRFSLCLRAVPIPTPAVNSA